MNELHGIGKVYCFYNPDKIIWHDFLLHICLGITAKIPAVIDFKG